MSIEPECFVSFHPADHAGIVMREIDERMGSLSGLENLDLMQNWFTRAGLV